MKVHRDIIGDEPCLISFKRLLAVEAKESFGKIYCMARLDP